MNRESLLCLRVLLTVVALFCPWQCSCGVSGRTGRSKVFFTLDKIQQLKDSTSELNNQALQKSLDIAALRKNGWTMLVGDSVLQQEFFSIVRSVQPSCSLMVNDLAQERRDPLGFFQAGAAPEYSLICRKGHGCNLRHDNCLHLTVPEPCPSYTTNPFCAHNKHPLCDDGAWKKLADEATASDVEFALTFHWAPGPGLARRDPDIGDLHGDPLWEASSAALRSAGQSIIKKRFEYRHPGAILMNNCLHSWPYSWRLPQQAWSERLELFLRALQLNLQEVAASGFNGAFTLQTCMPLACTQRFAWRTIDPTLRTCQLQNAELMAVNAGTKRLLEAMHLQGSLYEPWKLGAARPELYIDGIHPCWTRPCSWTNNNGVPVTPVQSHDERLLWTGFVDTDPSLCFDVVSSAFAALGQPSARFTARSTLGAKLPSLSDLSASLFLPDVPRLVLPPPQAVAVLPHPTAGASKGTPQPGVPGATTPLPGTPGVGAGAAPTGMPLTPGVPVAGATSGTGMPATKGVPPGVAAGATTGTGMPAIPGAATATGQARPPAQTQGSWRLAGGVQEPVEQESGLPLWTWLFFSLLGFMCISQYIPKQGLFVDHELAKGNAKTRGLTFRLFSIVENDPEQQVST